MRKHLLATGNYYHIFNRSIANYVIFNGPDDYRRMIDTLDLYRFKDFSYSFSYFCDRSLFEQQAIINRINKSEKLVDIISFCLMPTHPHLVLKQNCDKGITQYISKVLNSYSRYFNEKHKRKGPLWEGHFESRLIRSDELLLHTTRYAHLNPVTAKLVERPEDWAYSSYHQYIGRDNSNEICDFNSVLDIKPDLYKKFVNDRISYQRELSKIKKIIAGNY
jgi:putative transposase